MQLQPKFGAQFTVSGSAWMPDDSPRPQLECRRLQAGTSARCVNDEELLERQFDTTADATFWRESGISEGFERVPLHCYLHLFHLDFHRNLWVHVQNVREYRYKPQLRDKLVLPQAHRDLIDILTADRNFLMEDIVEGKSGGTTILCKGAPGLGKTLTAEVYAEVVGKPLYRVHSGQLGVTAGSVEANLSKILQRAARWDSVLLLDEADVYIRRRDNDLQHNAIVAEFLRTLEYFNGLLFMTTNRVADIDDAILSRCIAIIQFETPTKEQAAQLWKSLAEQFHADLPDEPGGPAHGNLRRRQRARHQGTAQADVEVLQGQKPAAERRRVCPVRGFSQHRPDAMMDMSISGWRAVGAAHLPPRRRKPHQSRGLRAGTTWAFRRARHRADRAGGPQAR
jgi:hypothetical protein